MSAQPSLQQSERALVVRATAIIGICLGIFQSIVWLIAEPLTSGVTSSPSLAAFLFLVAPLIWCIAFFLEGIWIGKRTGQMGQSILNGLFGGLFGGLVAAVGHVLTITFSLGPGQNLPLITAYSVLGVALWTLTLTVSGGVSFGAVGGFVGQYLSPTPLQFSRPRVPPGGPSVPPSYPPPYPPSTAPQPHTSPVPQE